MQAETHQRVLGSSTSITVAEVAGKTRVEDVVKEVRA